MTYNDNLVDIISRTRIDTKYPNIAFHYYKFARTLKIDSIWRKSSHNGFSEYYLRRR